MVSFNLRTHAMVNECSLKEWLAETLIGKRANFKCSCIVPFDITGVVVSYDIVSNEILWNVNTQEGKIIRIGENTPNMFISVLN